MKTFKQFISEAGRTSRIGSVLYSAPSGELYDFAIKHKDALEKIVATLKPPTFYGNQRIKVDAYNETLGDKAYLKIRIPIPNDLEPGDIGFFVTLASKTVRRDIGTPSDVECIDKGRNYFKADEFPGVVSRRSRPVSAGDIVIISVVPR